ALCRAAIAAVYKPSNLPVSRDPAVFAELKNINLTVEQ
ncbi:MAG: cell envelope integrity TolA C-terminal domain-containing protein, partial [Glaciecola sp.]